VGGGTPEVGDGAQATAVCCPPLLSGHVQKVLLDADTLALALTKRIDNEPGAIQRGDGGGGARQGAGVSRPSDRVQPRDTPRRTPAVAVAVAAVAAAAR